MKLLMFNIAPTLRETLIAKLIASGIEVFISEKEIESLDLIKKFGISIVLMDIDIKDIDFLDFAKSIRKEKGLETTRFITLAKSIDKEIISKYVPYGLIGFLPKNLEMDVYAKKIVKWADSHKLKDEKRKNIRITPDKMDNMIIKLPITGRTNADVSGKIIDLSIQGIAFKFDNPDNKNYFMLNQEIKKAAIEIGGRRYLTDVKLVRVDEVCVAVYFKPKEGFINSIARYIFDKLSEGYKRA